MHLKELSLSFVLKKKDVKWCDIVKMLQKAFVESSMHEQAVYKWYKCFKVG